MAPLFPQYGVAGNPRGSLPLTNAYQGNQSPSMSINFPTMLQQPNNTPNPVLVGVHGFDSVKQFPTRPNETIALHDLDADFEYVVNTDVNNQPSYKILEFSQITEEEYREKYAKAVNRDTVVLTSEEYSTILKRIDKLEREVNANAKQPVRYPKSGDVVSDKPNDASAKPAAGPANTRDVSEVKPQQ